MGAVRMRIQTADKHITIILSTPVHQLTSGEVKQCISCRLSHQHPATLNQIKSLLLSHHHSTSALVSEILMSVLQTVQKNNKQITYGQTVQKNCTGAFTVLQTVQKKQQQFTYGQYIFTDCTEDNVQNTHTYTQYT